MAAEKMETPLRMPRQVGIFSGMALVVSTMIGSGIFISPQLVLKRSDSVGAALSVWAFSALVALGLGFCSVDLARICRRSGGYYQYIQSGFGPLHAQLGALPAFVFVFVDSFVMLPTNNALQMLVVARFLLGSIDDGGCLDGDDDWVVKIVAWLALMLLLFLNAVGMRLVAPLAIGAAVVKAAALAVVIGVGAAIVLRDWSAMSELFDDAFQPLARQSGTVMGRVVGVSLAFYSSMWAYQGADELSFIEEMSARSIPIAICGGLLSVAFLYILANISYMLVLTPRAMLQSDSGAVLAVAVKTLPPLVAVVTPLAVALSVFTSNLIGTLNRQRRMYSAGRSGHFCSLFAFVNLRTLTPLFGLFVDGLLASVFIFSGSIYQLLDFLFFLTWFTQILNLSALCILKVRLQRRGLGAMSLTPLWLPVAMSLFCAFQAVVPFVFQPTVKYFIAVFAIALACSVYVVFVLRRFRMEKFDLFTKFVQKVLLLAPEDLPDFIFVEDVVEYYAKKASKSVD